MQYYLFLDDDHLWRLKHVGILNVIISTEEHCVFRCSDVINWLLTMHGTHNLKFINDVRWPTLPVPSMGDS